MTDEVINLGAKRAERSRDSHDWTPLDALRDAIADIESGKRVPKNIAIHFWEEQGDGVAHHFYCAGLSYVEHIALLEMAKQRTLEEWRK